VRILHFTQQYINSHIHNNGATVGRRKISALVANLKWKFNIAVKSSCTRWEMIDEIFNKGCHTGAWMRTDDIHHSYYYSLPRIIIKLSTKGLSRRAFYMGHKDYIG